MTDHKPLPSGNRQLRGLAASGSLLVYGFLVLAGFVAFAVVAVVGLVSGN